MVLVKERCLSFRGDAKALAEAIAPAASVAPHKSPRAVVQNLLLVGREGVLYVTGTDLEVTVRVRIEQVELRSEGRALVNAARFLGILRELVGEQVNVSLDDRAGCTISTSDARFQVMGEDADDFPDLGAWPEEGGFTLKAREFLGMVRRTHFATHAEKTRYAMNGILLDLRDDRVRLVATDGKRLALCERPLLAKGIKPMHVVIPTKALLLMQRLVGDGEEELELALESSQVFLRSEGATLSARLVQGHFPPYEDVLPAAGSHEKVLRIPREAFLSALRRAVLLETKDSQAVRFRFFREGLELKARVPEVGESEVRFPLDFPFEELEVGFNPHFFSDVLKVLQGAEFSLELKDGESAAVIREEGPAGQRFVYLVMPLSLGS